MSKEPTVKSSRRLIIGTISPLITILISLNLIGTGFAQSSSTGKSGHPLPRFVSLKSQKVNMRVGPSTDHKILWRYEKRGLPMEIIQESDNWRKVRDAEGNEGWILHSLLSGKRTAIINPWERDKVAGLTALHADNLKNGHIKAKMEPGVVAEVEGCEEKWCRISVGDTDGYVAKQRLWGVYPDELIEE